MASERRGSVIDSVRHLFDTGSLSALSEGQLLERFLVEKDQTAFEAIVLRHGAMVLGVCRRILHDPHDVDDAFQATFLVLVEKARSIRNREVLGIWLHGVARRVAVRAKVNARRRRTRERPGIEEAAVEGKGLNHTNDQELRSMIDKELDCLPYRYRAPLVLCDLEGQTYEQAAAQLRCPVGTVKSRLARGRERLRTRLIRQGLAPSAGLIVSILSGESASAVPLALKSLTIGAAAQCAAGQAAAAGLVSAEVAALTKEVIRSTGAFQLKIMAGAILAIGLTTAGAGAFLHQSPAPPDRTERARFASPTGQTSEQEKERLVAVANDVASPIPGGERFQLENGLRVILRPIQGARQTALIVVYAIGEHHDPEGRSGLAHVLEHTYITAAAGPQKARSAEDFIRLYPDGANAQTGDLYTVFSTSLPGKNLEAELQDAAARMGNLQLADSDLERERPRVLQEVANMFGAFPTLASLNNAHSLIHPAPGTGRKGGQLKEIDAITREHVQARWARYYKPRNATLGLAGALDPKAARKAVETYFGKLAPGEPIPAPRPLGKPRFGEVRELTVRSPLPNAESSATLAYRAPQPGSDLYAPFLVLATRLFAGAAKLGKGGPTGQPLFFSPLDDPRVLAVSTTVRGGETTAQALARIETVVAEILEPKLNDHEPDATQQQLGLLLGTIQLPDQVLAQNPYGVVFSIVRRGQLGIDSAKLKRDLATVTDEDLRRVIKEVFAPGRHAGAVISLAK